MRAHPGPRGPSLLCNVNFPSNTGFAWNYIEGMYARLADHLRGHGIRTLVAYPSIPSAPKTLQGSAAEAVELDTSLSSPGAVARLVDFIRRENVQALYWTDRPALHPAYPLLRAAGVRRIVVHDHASGRHEAPRGPKRWVKWGLARAPFVPSDAVIAVSDFVARRQVDVGLQPPGKVHRIYNAVRPPASAAPTGELRARVGATADQPLVVCACRATPQKGVAHLLRAFDCVLSDLPASTTARPVLAYLGDGPGMEELRGVHRGLRHASDIHLLGYEPRAAELLRDADLCVVPSVWDEAFGLAVVEPMAAGKAVIASCVGGIPELIRHGETGLLVPPGDEPKLAQALKDALADGAARARMGAAAKSWVEAHLSVQRKLEQLLPFVEAAFEVRCVPSTDAVSPRAASAPAATGAWSASP